MRALRTAPVVLCLALGACGDDDSSAAGPYHPSDQPDASAADGAEADAVAVDGQDVPDGPAGQDAQDAQDAQEGGVELPGYIGSPCVTVADCDFDGAECLTTGFPGGACTLPCADTCPDQEGFPVTFCGAASEVPEAAAIGDGLCLSRCDFEYYPESGCRAGYGCAKIGRPNDAGAIRFACLPNRTHELSSCYFDLAARGVGFEPTVVADESPDTNPGLLCHVEDPLYLKSPVHGIALRDSGGSETPRILASCTMAGAVVSTIDDVAPSGVIGFRHMGTYNCRVIAGTNVLSEHSFGDAIDIAGFDFSDGRLWTVLDDWEHGTTTPQTDAGQFLYAAAHRWFDAYYWNIILTPNYNADHDNHFHVDMTSGSHFLGFKDGRYIGPAPYAD